MFEFLRKKKEEEPLPPVEDRELPEDLERFRMERTQLPAPEPPPERAPMREFESREFESVPRIEEPPKERESSDKIELIIQKLETIDARLKLIEERLRR